VANDSSITHWIAALKTGDADAAQRLWDGYFHRLVNLARGHLGMIARGGSDGEDVAQSVFKSLCLGAERGKFPQLLDRNNLWALLVAMTTYKSRDLMRRERYLKRGGGRVMDQGALAAGQETMCRIEDFIGREPTPEFAAQVAEQCESLLSKLTDVRRRTAELKLQGYTNEEIAGQMDCGLRTVERRLNAVRLAWSDDSEQ
jgi:DNA-directed RNA polymerase specialized sigma24 family protein